MKTPTKLYRFRWLDKATADREIDALTNAYLYAPPFSAMNDPMEAFYETGGPGDGLVDAVFGFAGKSSADLYQIVDKTIDQFALVSFTGTFEALPLWAYYANNFSGICLEFDTRQLIKGEFKGEPLRPVVYARSALSPIGLQDFGEGKIKEAVVARLCRKRVEWSHEREWRFLTGTVGKKHYLDDALSKIYLGPRISDENARLVCAAVRHRPTEVLQGRIRGFELEFASVQPATQLSSCERVGAGKFSLADDLYAEKELRAFLGDAYDALVQECKHTLEHPNAEELAGIDLASSRPDAIYFHTVYKLRNGHSIYDKRYFNSRMRLV